MPDRKKADSLLVYAKFAHRGSVAALNVILRLLYILGNSGAVSRVERKEATKVFMGYIQLNQKRLLWSLVFGHIEQCNDFLE